MEVSLWNSLAPEGKTDVSGYLANTSYIMVKCSLFLCSILVLILQPLETAMGACPSIASKHFTYIIELLLPAPP